MLLSITEIAGRAVHMCRTHIRELLKVLIWIFIPTTIEALIPTLPIPLLSASIILIALQIVIVLVSLWLSVILVDLMVSYLGDNTTPHPKPAKKILSRILDFTLISLLQGLIVLAGFILFIIPGIVFANWFAFARYAVLIDHSSPGKDALKRSKALVTKRFWAIAWRWIGTYLYFGSLIALISIIILGAVGLILGNSGSAFASEAPWWAHLILSIVATLTTPLFVAVGVILYEDAKKTQ